MFRRSVSPLRVFSIFAAIGVAVLIYFTLHPKLAVVPVPSSDPGAAFGTVFNLRNSSVSVLYELSSSYCVNSFQRPDGTGIPAGTNPQLGVPSPSISLPDLTRKDAVALPVDNLLSGPPGSQVDLVLAIKFQPGWWIDLIVRQFRFVGTENPDKSWTWKEIPTGGACG
jgi:hypothetical protein